MKLPRLNRPVVLVPAVVLALLLAGSAFAATYAYAGDVPRGTVVLGVDIGGMSRDEAVSALAAGLIAEADALAAPVDVQIGEATTQIDPVEVGLEVDVAATVDQALGRQWHPFKALFGTRYVPPVVVVDSALLHEQLQEVAEDAGADMIMPEIRFDGTTPVPVYPEPGFGLDPERSAEAVTGNWPRIGEVDGHWRPPAVIPVPLVELHPVTTAEDVDQLIRELAEPAVAAAVTVTVQDGATFEVPPAAIAASLRLKADDQGEIVPKVSHKALRKALRDVLAQVETTPVDASVALGGSGPVIKESRDGVEIDTKQLATDLLPVLPAPTPRTVAASVTTVEPEITTEDVADWGIKEQVSSFTSHFDGGLALPRNHNIAQVAEMVDGAVLAPGEVFSLNGYTGERGYAQGFVDAPVILNGRLTPAVGGGISQFTTTLFNAAYYAGLKDVEHQPHSYYYSRYPAVIEATIFYPSLDMKFQNDTPYGVLIDTSYNDSAITVTMWSTKVWDEITTEYGPRRNVTQPKTEYLKPGPECIATVGIEGFTQDAWRVFWRDGKEVKREVFTWRYDAQPEFICGERPSSA